MKYEVDTIINKEVRIQKYHFQGKFWSSKGRIFWKICVLELWIFSHIMWVMIRHIYWKLKINFLWNKEDRVKKYQYLRKFLSSSGDNSVYITFRVMNLWFIMRKIYLKYEGDILWNKKKLWQKYFTAPKLLSEIRTRTPTLGRVG